MSHHPIVRRQAFRACLVVAALALPFPTFGGPTFTSEITLDQGGSRGDLFGVEVRAVAINGDVAAVAASPSRSFSAWDLTDIFVRKDGQWKLQTTLSLFSSGLWLQETALEADGGGLAISADTLFVGLRGALVLPDVETGGNRAYAGGVAVFLRAGDSWNYSQLLTRNQVGEPDSGDVSDNFAYSVAIEGDYAVVGAPNYRRPGAPDSGAAYVFVRNAGKWTLQQRLEGTAAAHYFGAAVAITPNTIAIGASGESAVQVFRRDGVTWLHQARLTAEGGSLGHAMAMSGDTILAGAPVWGELAYPNLGAAYVFTRTGSTWSPFKRIGQGGNIDDLFGWAVALSGTTAVIGAPNEPSNFGMVRPPRGAAHVFARDGLEWTETQALRASDGVKDDQFGRYVATSSQAALVTAPMRDFPDINPDSGVVYLYQAPVASNRPPIVECPAPVSMAAEDPNGVAVTMTATVTDPDGDGLTVDWWVDGVNVKTTAIAALPEHTPVVTTVTLTRTYPLGVHAVKLEAFDGALKTECATSVKIGAKPPALQARHTGTGVLLTWPGEPAAFQLQFREKLNNPVYPWKNFALTPVKVGNESHVNLPASQSSQYFRLQSP